MSTNYIYFHLPFSHVIYDAHKTIACEIKPGGDFVWLPRKLSDPLFTRKVINFSLPSHFTLKIYHRSLPHGHDGKWETKLIGEWSVDDLVRALDPMFRTKALTRKEERLQEYEEKLTELHVPPSGPFPAGTYPAISEKDAVSFSDFSDDDIQW